MNHIKFVHCNLGHVRDKGNIYRYLPSLLKVAKEYRVRSYGKSAIGIHLRIHFVESHLGRNAQTTYARRNKHSIQCPNDIDGHC